MKKYNRHERMLLKQHRKDMLVILAKALVFGVAVAAGSWSFAQILAWLFV